MFQPLSSVLRVASVYPSTLWFECCTQTTTFTRSKTHASPTRRTPTRMLMLDAAHVWAGCHDLSGISRRHLGLPQTLTWPQQRCPWESCCVYSMCIHGNCMYTHRKGVLAGVSHTHTHLQQFCVCLNATQNVVLWKEQSRQNATHAAQVIQVQKHTKMLTHTSYMSHFFHEDQAHLGSKLSAGEVMGGDGRYNLLSRKRLDMQTEHKGGMRMRTEAKLKLFYACNKVSAFRMTPSQQQSVVKIALQSLFRKVCYLYLQQKIMDGCFNNNKWGGGWTDISFQFRGLQSLIRSCYCKNKDYMFICSRLYLAAWLGSLSLHAGRGRAATKRPPGVQNRVGTNATEIILTQHKTQEPGWRWVAKRCLEKAVRVGKFDNVKRPCPSIHPSILPVNLL